MNRIDLQERIAVITGGAQGIGLAVAERFVASGAKVVLWDIDAALLAIYAAAGRNADFCAMGRDTLLLAPDQALTGALAAYCHPAVIR